MRIYYRGEHGGRLTVRDMDDPSYVRYLGDFDWGRSYEVEDLAQAILSDLYGKRSEQVRQLLARFKVDVIEKLDGRFMITEEQIRAYVAGAEFRTLGTTKATELVALGLEDPWVLARALFEALANADVYTEESLFEVIELASRLVEKVKYD